jgi:hypothetical protein
MRFQEFQHDKTLGSTTDVGANRIAQDSAVIQEFVKDTSLRTMLRNRLEGIERFLIDGETSGRGVHTPKET